VENATLSQANTALRAETQRLTAAVEASNIELRRVLGLDSALVRGSSRVVGLEDHRWGWSPW
jgi:hypothetical protein